MFQKDASTPKMAVFGVKMAIFHDFGSKMVIFGHFSCFETPKMVILGSKSWFWGFSKTRKNPIFWKKWHFWVKKIARARHSVFLKNRVQKWTHFLTLFWFRWHRFWVKISWSSYYVIKLKSDVFTTWKKGVKNPDRNPVVFFGQKRAIFGVFENRDFWGVPALFERKMTLFFMFFCHCTFLGAKNFRNLSPKITFFRVLPIN